MSKAEKSCDVILSPVFEIVANNHRLRVTADRVALDALAAEVKATLPDQLSIELRHSVADRLESPLVYQRHEAGLGGDIITVETASLDEQEILIAVAREFVMNSELNLATAEQYNRMQKIATAGFALGAVGTGLMIGGKLRNSERMNRHGKRTAALGTGVVLGSIANEVRRFLRPVSAKTLRALQPPVRVQEEML